MSWEDLGHAAPELATFGAKRFESGVAYIATVRKDGAPRIHPVTPIIGQGHLFVFMEPTSPKGHDLRCDGRYSLHSSVSDPNGTSGEFIVMGRAKLVDDLARRSVASQLSVQTALSTIYEDGRPVRQHWHTTPSDEAG